MRTRIIIVLALLTLALIGCAAASLKSRKPIAKSVALLIVSLIPPIVGNLIIIFSEIQMLTTIGCYIYFIGLDWSVVSLLRFSCEYCKIDYIGTTWRRVILALVLIDVGQLLANIVTGHAFTTEMITVEGAPYYVLVPFLGQNLHRVIAYGIFFLSVGIFVYTTAKCARIYVERYAVILASMVFTGAWETYYIFSGSPIDRSMLGFGFFGMLVYFFAMHYRPFRLLDRMLSRVVSGMGDSVFFFDTSGSCIYCNDCARNLVNIDAETIIDSEAGSRVRDLIGGWKHKFNTEWNDMRETRIDGVMHYFDVFAHQILDDKDRHVGASLIIRDVTEERIKLIRERRIASHDRLTDLYNKEYLYEKMRAILDENPDTDYVVVALDVKDFKIINDIFSKEFGDVVLCNIADFLRENAAPGSVYGRLTGDKFGFMTPLSNFDAQALEDGLRNRSFAPAGIDNPIVLHAGIYQVDEMETRPSVMFDRAFMAIAAIKSDFQTVLSYYDKTMRDATIWNQQISSQLDSAIVDGQIKPYLQPLVDSSGRIVGAEALVRWIHPEEGFLAPVRFIPVFENNGMIAKLDAYMWECACRILKNWERQGIDLFLSVNISPKDFYFIDVYGTICDLVDKYAINPEKLRIEITETVMMSDMENRLRILENLRSRGFLVEMDDFGSGYSSLNLLKDMPVDVLKIDMMFLYKTKDQVKAQTILQTIINLSENLGISSITEGVETADQHDMLLQMGCRLFQGYFFAKPMPVEEFEKLYHAA